MGASNKWHSAWFSVCHESPCVRFLRYSDRKLTVRTVIWKDNRFINPVIRFKGFPFCFSILTEKFCVPSVAFWPSGAVLCFSASSLFREWFLWIEYYHRQISCLKVVLPQAKCIWGSKPLWAARIRWKDGSTVDSFEETLEVYIILDPNNLVSSISSTKVVYQ